jgi:glucosamine 6-phosphate synthetase-like amidotransferase/phosphosugar isomerase protein
MCGLMYVKSLDGIPAAKRLLKRYEEQKARGTEGFGYITLEKGKIEGYKRFMDEKSTENSLKNELATEILFHHRYPTSTINIPEAAHPILVKSPRLKNQYYVAHNGVIRNADELKSKHELQGWKYRTEIASRTEYKVGGKKYLDPIEKTFNDSESFAIELANFLAGKSDKIEALGSIAFICIEARKDGTPLWLHYGRGNNPLVMETTNQLVAIKSEGKGEFIEGNRINSFSYLTGENTSQQVDLGLWKPVNPVHPLLPSSYNSSGQQTMGFQAPTKEDIKLETPESIVTNLNLQELEEEAMSLEENIDMAEEDLVFYRQEKCYDEVNETLRTITTMRKKLENLQVEIEIMREYEPAV